MAESLGVKPSVLEDEQQEHPTHGHHTEFKPKGKAPRNLEPLNSAPITIPLAYMKGSEVKVCDRGWSNGQLRLDVTNIRNQLEMLYRDTGNDTDTSHRGKKKRAIPMIPVLIPETIPTPQKRLKPLQILAVPAVSVRYRTLVSIPVPISSDT